MVKEEEGTIKAVLEEAAQAAQAAAVRTMAAMRWPWVRGRRRRRARRLVTALLLELGVHRQLGLEFPYMIALVYRLLH